MKEKQIKIELKKQERVRVELEKLKRKNNELRVRISYNQALKDVEKLIGKLDYIEVHNFLNNKEELMVSARQLKQKLKELSK